MVGYVVAPEYRDSWPTNEELEYTGEHSEQGKYRVEVQVHGE